MALDLGLAKGHLGLIERSALNLRIDTLEGIAAYLHVPLFKFLMPRKDERSGK